MVGIRFVVILEAFLEGLDDFFKDKCSFFIEVEVFAEDFLSFDFEADVHEKYDLGSADVTQE